MRKFKFYAVCIIEAFNEEEALEKFSYETQFQADAICTEITEEDE